MLLLLSLTTRTSCWRGGYNMRKQLQQLHGPRCTHTLLLLLPPFQSSRAVTASTAAAAAALLQP